MTESDLPGAVAAAADDALASPLTAEEAAHLLRRTAFVARTEDVQKWTGRSWHEALAELVDAAPEPRLVNPPFTYRRPNQDQNDTDAELLLATELDRLVGSVGLGDRMLWFWHNVFTSSASSVDQPVLLYRQHELLARHSLGSLRQLATDISSDPAMLIFLNGDDSYADAPNENYARELMELFTLGRGTFSQSDVVAGARVLAGWDVKNVPDQPGSYDPNAMRAVLSSDARLAAATRPA